MLIDIRSKEIVNWRKNVRDLSMALADIEKTALANDKIMLALHKVALVLIENKKQWVIEVEKILTQHLTISACRIVLLNDVPNDFKKLIRALPAKGKIEQAALAPSVKCSGAKSYFYLPLKKNKRSYGVLVLADKKINAFPSDASNDLVRRLGELIIAKL